MVDFNFTQHSSTTTTDRSIQGGTYHFAQVVQTSNEDPELPIGAVKFRIIGTSVNTVSDYALPYFQSIKSIPLIDEYVMILTGIGESANLKRSYYLPAVNIWNHPQHGGLGANDSNPNLGVFQEAQDINPMYPFPGDLLLEGRKGQSIRFSESSKQTPWKSDTSHSPVIIISSGQIKTQEGYTNIQEDINEDPASMYLASHNQLPLRVDQKWVKFENGERYSSYLPGNEPLEASSYLGNQIVLNSGRIYINSNKEHILLSATDKIGLLGKTVNIDADKTITFEAPTINLTGHSLDPLKVQSAIRGTDLSNELIELYKHLSTLSLTLQTVLSTLNVPTDTAAELFTFVNSGLIVQPGEVESRLKKLLSKKVKLT